MSQTSGTPEPQFVQVAVPVDLVEAVYEFITAHRTAQRAPVPQPTAPRQPPAAQQAEREWDGDALRQLVDHGSEALAAVLSCLVQQALTNNEQEGWWVPMDRVAAAAGKEPGRSAGGWFSRQQRASQSNYGLDLPIEARWDDQAGRQKYRLHPPSAVKPLARALKAQ